MRGWKAKNNEVLFSLAWNIIFSDNLKVLVLKFLETKDMVLLSQKVDGNMIFINYWKALVLNFWVMGNTVFYESRSWWKDNICWLLRSYCFKLFGDGKYGLFSAKKFMERWYLHGLFELSMIFQDPGNMVFRAVISPPNGSYVKENIDSFLYDNIILNLFYQSNY